MSSRCLIIGAGPMGQAHAKACREVGGVELTCFAPSTRHEEAVRSLGASFEHGRLEDAIQRTRPTHAIVAGPIETLASSTKTLLTQGVDRILVEKPAFLSVHEGNDLLAASVATNAKVYVAYNRRFYGSVRAACALIDSRGEVMRAVTFEFTEWIHKVEALDRPAAVKQHWVLANSAHVIDLGLFRLDEVDLARTMCLRSGGLPWHSSAAVMLGAGVTKAELPFTYLATWGSPGRWGVEWITDKTRYIFKPLEALKTQALASLQYEEVALPDDLDTRFKPGVYLQDRAFILESDHSSLASLERSVRLGELIARIAGY